MQHAEIRKLLASRLACFKQARLPVTLYPHQVETLEKTLAWLENTDGARRGYVSHATGLGKTILFASLLRFCEGLRTLVIVSTKTLVDQTVRKLVGFSNGSMSHMSSLPTIHDEDGNVLAKRWKDQAFDVLIATDESFKTKRALERIAAFAPQVIIWDECHWGYTERAQNALAMFPEAVVLAFSATPDFLTNVCKHDYAPVTLDNGQVLYGTPDRFARTHFGDPIDDRGALWGIEHGHLAQLAWGRLEFTLSLEGIPTVQGPAGLDYDQSALSKTLAKNWPFVAETICKLYQSGQYGLASRFSAAICPGVKQAYEIVEALKGIGVTAACITHSTPDVERRRILQAGERGELAFLASVFALREGWDSPNAEVAMMLRPTKSRVLYLQFMGRVLRKRDGKTALVLDPHYQNARFAPLSAPVLFGRPGQEVYDGGILVGPKNGKARKAASWFTAEKLSKLKPVLVVEKIDVEYWAGPDGTFEADGERWATIKDAARLLDKLTEHNIASRLDGCRRRKGMVQGHSCDFYAVSDLEMACVDLLGKIPRAESDGTFMADGETWVTMEAAGRIMDKISKQTVQRRCFMSGECRHRRGRTKEGLFCDFYALSDLEKACVDLLEILPQARPDGTFKADGETWTTIAAAIEKLKRKISATAVAARIARLPSRKGRASGGQLCSFYKLSDIRKVCADLLGSLPKAGLEGVLEANGETWVTISKAEVLFGKVGRNAMKVRLHGCRHQKGKTSGGAIYTFYALSDLEKACAELLGDLPQALPDGTFEADGERWATIKATLKLFGKLSYSSIASRLAKCRNRKGRAPNGRLCDYYALSDLKRVCADLLENVPQAGSNGTFDADGEKWGTSNAARRLVGVSESAVRARLAQCRKRPGKNGSRLIVTFYALSDVKKACADLLAKKKRRARKK